MPEPVQGYITDDGRFFTSRAEAHYQEAKFRLLRAMESMNVSDDALDWIDNLSTELGEYIEAKEKFDGVNPETNNTKPVISQDQIRAPKRIIPNKANVKRI